MSYIHILLTMLIILNITANRLSASTTSKTSYILDFNEVFWHADKRGKTRGKQGKTCGKTRGKRGKFRGKLQIMKFFLQTRCIADVDYLPTFS